MFNVEGIPPSKIYEDYCKMGTFDLDPYSFFKFYLETIKDETEILNASHIALNNILEVSKTKFIKHSDKETNKFLKGSISSTVSYNPSILFGNFGILLDFMYDNDPTKVPNSTYALIMNNADIEANIDYPHSLKYILYKGGGLSPELYSRAVTKYVHSNLKNITYQFNNTEENVYDETGFIFRLDATKELECLLDIKYSCVIFKHIPEDFAVTFLTKYWTIKTYRVMSKFLRTHTMKKMILKHGALFDDTVEI